MFHTKFIEHTNTIASKWSVFENDKTDACDIYQRGEQCIKRCIQTT